MTIKEFKKLHKYEQEEIITYKGEFLGTYNQGDQIYDTYQLGSFYVTFLYALNDYNDITIEIFDNPARLPFLEEIKIPEF